MRAVCVRILVRSTGTLGTRGGTATFPTKAPTFAPSCHVSKTCGAWPRFPNPVPRWCVFLRLRVGGVFLCGPAVVEHARKKTKMVSKERTLRPYFKHQPRSGCWGRGGCASLPPPCVGWVTSHQRRREMVRSDKFVEPFPNVMKSWVMGYVGFALYLARRPSVGRFLVFMWHGVMRFECLTAH